MKLLAVPQTDLAEYGNLPEDCRRHIGRMLRAMSALCAAPRGQIGAAIAREAGALGITGKRLRAIWDEFRHSGNDWRLLIDRRRFPANTGRRLSATDAELMRKYAERNQRSNGTRAAYKRLVRDWRAGVASTSTPIDPRTGLPCGWSARNFYRQLRRAHLVAMRDGLGTAIGRHIGKVISTRVGLYVGSHYMFDDVQRDFKVLLLSGTSGKEALVGELGVLDVFSAHRFAVHRRPIFTADSGIKDSFKEREMRFLLAACLRNTGYSPRGTTCVTELGTAAIRKALAGFLHHVSNGLLDVKDAGIIGKAQAIPGLLGRGGGNPRHKARLESHHNLLHNTSGALIAATGHDRTPPEWLFGFERETRAVIKWIEQLSPQQAELLRVPMLEYWQSLAILAELDQVIAEDPEHDLEGWAACGHTTIEYRLDLSSDRWLSQTEFLALPDIAQARLQAMIDVTPTGVVARARKLSRIEAWSRGAGELIRLPDHVIALMFADDTLGEDLRQPRRINAEGEFVITASIAEPDPMQFRGEVETPAGDHLTLDPSITYGIVLNPFDRDRLWVFDPAGRYIGTAPRRVRPTYGDDESIRLQLGQRSHDIAALTAPLKERHADVSRALVEIHDHNRRIATGRTSTEQDRAADRIARRAAKFGTALATTLPSVPSAPSPVTIEEWVDAPADPAANPETQPATEQW